RRVLFRSGADPVDSRAHLDEELAEVLDVRLGCGVAEHRRAIRAHRGEDHVLRAGDAGLVEEDVGAGQASGLEMAPAAFPPGRPPQGADPEPVRVHAAPADLIAPRVAELGAAL